MRDLSFDRATFVARAGLCALMLATSCSLLGGSKPEAKERSVRGFYVYGHEVSSFTPCGSPKIYWVTGPAEIELRNAHREFARAPYDDVYVEVTGQPRGRATDRSLAADYDGLFYIDALVKARTAKPNDCSGKRATDAKPADPRRSGKPKT